MPAIFSNLSDLVREREIREKRPLSVRIICEESGASRSTVEGLLKNTMRRVPLEDLAALCQYLNCEIEDMLRLNIFFGTDMIEEPAPMQNPPIIHHAPFVGFHLYDRGDAYVWLHHRSIADIADSATGGTIITYVMDHNQNHSRSFVTTGTATDVRQIIAKTAQISEQAKLTQRSIKPPSEETGVIEALKWFSMHENTDFATNRFHGSINAKKFIRKLHRAGATYVGVIEQSVNAIEAYSDTMFIQTPVSWEHSVQLVALLAAETQDHGNVMESASQPYSFTIWWD